MTTTIIVLLLAAIVLVSLGLIVGSQIRERNRIDRARRIAALEDSYNRSKKLLTEIPGQYLTRDLELLLIQRMEKVCAGLRARKVASAAERQAETQQLKTAILEDQQKRTPVKVDTPEKSKYIQELLQALYKVLETMHKTGQIDAAVAKKSLKYVLFLVHKTHADLHVFQAREHVKQNQIRKAIHEYHLASTELNKSRDHPLAIKAIKSFRTRISELEATAQAEDTAKAADSESQSRLDREWDTFLHDDEWKKKADYDK